MKIAISIPDPLFERADALANQLGISRSQLYAKAVERYVEARLNADITRRLNEVYDSEDSTLDPVLNAMQLAALPREDW